MATQSSILVGYSPQGRKESDMAEATQYAHTHIGILKFWGRQKQERSKNVRIVQSRYQLLLDDFMFSFLKLCKIIYYAKKSWWGKNLMTSEEK